MTNAAAAEATNKIALLICTALLWWGEKKG
jgi:hypothetical protein